MSVDARHAFGGCLYIHIYSYAHLHALGKIEASAEVATLYYAYNADRRKIKIVKATKGKEECVVNWSKSSP